MWWRIESVKTCERDFQLQFVLNILQFSIRAFAFGVLCPCCSVSLCCILYSMSVSLCCILSYNTSVLYLCAVLGILHMSVTAEFHCCALLHCPLVWWWSPWQAVGSGQTILECGSRCSWWWRRQCFSQYAPTHPTSNPTTSHWPSFTPLSILTKSFQCPETKIWRGSCCLNRTEQKTQRPQFP